MPPRWPHVPRVPRILRLIGRAIGLPVSTVGAYWAQEARSIRTGSMALALGLAATLVAGIVLASAESQLQAVPGLLALIPAAIGMRGAIFGALGSRLATGILTGEFDRQLTRTSYLGRQVEASTVLTLASALQAGAIAWGVSAALGLETAPLLSLVAISLVGALLSSAVLFLVVIAMARRSQALGFNLDDAGAPIITATGDLVTLPALLLATLMLRVPWLAETIGVVGIVAGLVAVVLGLRTEDQLIRRVVRESLIVLTIAVTVDVLAGVVVQARAEEQFATAALLVLLPPFIANCGSLGGMLASRLASKLHVGQLDPRLLPGKLAVLDFTLITLLAVLAFSGVGLTGWLAAVIVPGVEPVALLSTIAVVLLAGVFALPIMSGTAYGAAAVSFRFGFDPDNHGIPVVTAVMDLTGVVCLLAAITVLGI
ncbi:MAG: magnesium transporter [Nitriliruptoraceae bacterium]